MNTTQGDTNDALRITSSSGISNTRRTNRRRHRFAWAARVLLGYLFLIVVEIVDRLGDTWLMRRLVNLIARHFSRWWPEPGPVRRMWRRTRQRAHPGLVALAERYHRFRREPDFDDWTIEHWRHPTTAPQSFTTSYLQDSFVSKLLVLSGELLRNRRRWWDRRCDETRTIRAATSVGLAAHLTWLINLLRDGAPMMSLIPALGFIVATLLLHALAWSTVVLARCDALAHTDAQSIPHALDALGGAGSLPAYVHRFHDEQLTYQTKGPLLPVAGGVVRTFGDVSGYDDWLSSQQLSTAAYDTYASLSLEYEGTVEELVKVARALAG